MSLAFSGARVKVPGFEQQQSAEAKKLNTAPHHHPLKTGSNEKNSKHLITGILTRLSLKIHDISLPLIRAG